MEQKIVGYKQLQLLYESNKTLIFRATKELGQPSVILKFLKDPQPSLSDVSKLVHSYEIVKNLQISGIVKVLRLEKQERRPILVQEDVAGVSLHDFLKDHNLDLISFLKIAARLANTLGDIHHHQIIHKDIKPANIIINRENLEVYICDFGIATRLTRENPKLINRHVLEGTLNYISPEQTGRMNRDIDYRTDIYSLGVTFYEMLTGKLPFESQDSLELIHLHIAKTPVFPHKIDPTIPRAVSAIILKCLEKMPEARYQSAYGIKEDLTECLQQLEVYHEIRNFHVGHQDISEIFQIPQKLYGREKEIDALLAAFDRTCMGDSECIMISGYTGVGKTALINEIQKPIVKQRGYFVRGKFDELKRDLPYTGLVEALADLINQALTESETDLAILKHKLLAICHSNGQILIELIPELELIIGKQPPAQVLGTQETQNRLKVLFKNFIRVFSKKEHPLVIFLDDLHWAEMSTLSLVKELMTDPSIQHLLLIGTYRTQEVSEGSPLMLTFNEIQKEQTELHILNLSPLNVDDIKLLTVDTLHCSSEKAAPLAQILHQKSGGNPFDLIQFLKKLHRDNYLFFNAVSKTWEWDLFKIQELDITENVINLIVKKIQELPEQTQDMLSVAATIGRRFDLRLLAFESNLSPSTILAILWRAVSDDIIIPVNENYRIIESKELEAINSESLANMEVLFEFTHDRLQQVAYSLISEDKRREIQYKIGKILLQHQFAERFEENIFNVIAHLNVAIPLIQNKEERLQLAKMNLQASLKAKNSAAYNTAYDCIRTAQTLLEANSWATHYELTYKIYLELTECCYLTQRFEHIDNLSHVILQNAKTNLEKGSLYIIKIISYTNIAQTQKAIEEGLECLELFDIKLNRNPGKARIMLALMNIKWKLRGLPIAALENLPVMNDPEKLFLMGVLANLCTPAFISDKNLLCLVTLKMMELILKHGVCDLSYFVYVSYATMLEILFRDYQRSYELGLLAIKVADQSHNNTYRCRANFVMASVINHWKNHLKHSEQYMHACYTSGLESGEVMYTSFISVFWGFLEGSFFIDLPQALKNLRRYKNTIFSIKSKQAIHSFVVKEGLILALQDPQFHGQTIKYEDFDEPKYYDILFHDSELQVAFQAYVAYRSVIYYLFDMHKESLALYKVSEPTRRSIYALTQERDINVYYSLTMLALYPTASWKDKIRYRWQIRKNQKLLRKWVEECPENNLHRYLLVEAERARNHGDMPKALSLYDQAIVQAHNNQYYVEEAIAAELAGRAHLLEGKVFIARAYLEHAYQCYHKADVKSKLEALECQFDFLQPLRKKLSRQPISSKLTLDSTFGEERTASSTTKSSSLDLATVLQATSVIGGAIHLETLLNQLMQIIIESAGADRAFLIREENGRWLIQAERDLNKATSNVLQGIPFEHEVDLLSVIIVQYVIRTKQTVVLNDAMHIGMFTEDPYINQYKPKSILCFPVSHQGKLSTVLYAENNAATDAFTPERLDILQLLSGQIATSIENATLYSNIEAASENLKAFNRQLEDYNRNLENKVADRTKELQNKNEQLRETLEALKEMQRQVVQQEKLAALGLLSHGIAHEIKNPLNFINNFSSLSVELLDDLSELIPQGDEKEKDREIHDLLKHLKINLEKIHTHSLRVDGIVVSMLKHSKESKGHKELTELNKVLKEYLYLTKKSFEEKNPNIVVAIESSFDPALQLIEIVPQDVARAVMNILDNAFYSVVHRFKIEGVTYQPLISVSSLQLADCVEIHVGDNGMGISKEHREKLFHPFFTTKPTGTGTGLGLSIAYDIVVQEHGGEIQVQSEPKKFTEFIIRLPHAEQ